MLVNADGKTVSRRKLARELKIMEDSVHTYIGSLRAKIGEARYAASLIITDWPSEENDYQTGWYFVEPS
jgi:DNA-binding response OmpR family regulator